MAQVKALGVWFSIHPQEILTLNYQEKFKKGQNVLSSWSFHRLTFIGKITVPKGLTDSQ